MDPTQYYQFLAQMQQPSGMFGGQPTAAQQPSPQMGDRGGGGFNPMMLLSPLGGMLMHNPKAGLEMGISPLLTLMGAFK